MRFARLLFLLLAMIPTVSNAIIVPTGWCKPDTATCKYQYDWSADCCNPIYVAPNYYCPKICR